MTPAKQPYSDSWMMVAVRPFGQRVVIVGGGAVARRRAELFARHGAIVKMYDPFIEPRIEAWPDGVTFYNRRASKRDLQNAWLVIAATDDPAVNERVAIWADELGLEINRADDVNEGTFAVPSLIESEDGWQVAVLGGDAGPLFSGWLKDILGYIVNLPKVSKVYRALASARMALRSGTFTQQQRADAMRAVLADALESDVATEEATVRERKVKRLEE